MIRSRLFPNRAAIQPVWNTFPGALVTTPRYSKDPEDFPFYHIKLKTEQEQFTAVIHTTTSVVRESSSLFRLIRNVGQSKFVAKVNNKVSGCALLMLSDPGCLNLCLWELKS